VVGKLFRVIFSRKSRQRLKEISDYYEDQASPAVARNVRKGLVSSARQLEKLPGSKPILPGTEDLDYPVRYTKKWSFKIIFRVLNASRIVRILTIRHDKEDPEDIYKDL
jgi:plasmid stabilization system protein ParE